MSEIKVVTERIELEAMKAEIEDLKRLVKGQQAEIDARAGTDDKGLPRYKLIGPCYFEDQYLEEGEEICWPDRPNEYMEALNEPARKKMAEYMEFIAECNRLAGRRDGRTPSLADLAYEAMLKRPKEPASEMPSIAADAPAAEAPPSKLTFPKANPDKPLTANDPRVVAARAKAEPKLTIMPPSDEGKKKVPVKVFGPAVDETATLGVPRLGI